MNPSRTSEVIVSIGSIGSGYAPSNVNAQVEQSVIVAKKALDQTKEEGQEAVAMIKASSPDGTGQKLNVLA